MGGELNQVVDHPSPDRNRNRFVASQALLECDHELMFGVEIGIGIDKRFAARMAGAAECL